MYVFLVLQGLSDSSNRKAGLRNAGLSYAILLHH